MNFLLFLSCLVLLCFMAEGTKNPEDCIVGDRILKHGENGPAALGECILVQCNNGKISNSMSCGLIQLPPNCPRDEKIFDFTKLYPDCCIPMC